MSDEIEKLREELAESNARRADLRTALEWANEECDRLREQLAAKHSECPDCADYAARSGRFAEQADRLQRERDEAIKARDQYLRERDQARLAEERARESLDQLDEAIYDCLPSDDDGDAPLDCVEHAADQLRALAQERDEARAEVKWLREDDKAGLRRERDEACEMVTRIEQEAYRIKLEARAEVATAAKYCDELAETIRMHVAREIELEAEVERLREREREAMAVAHTQIELHLSAYRRGAEAMREHVMSWLVRAQAEATVIVVDTAIRGVHKLPIPEER